MGGMVWVLNARRHRSGGHISSRTRLIVLREVLNARRHRSGGHQFGARQLGISHLCSTPEGIGAAVTPALCLVEAQAQQVLNARRHRSGGHPDLRDLAKPRCGVLNARRHRSGGHVAPVCEIALRVGVLNARRHRSGGHSRV